MQSLILKTMARFLMPVLLVFSIFLFIRGHNEPGGGFVAGLVSAASLALYSIAYGARAARRLLWIDPRALIGLGLLTALASGLLPAFNDQPFLTGQWGYVTLPGLGGIEVGTPVLFDLGVYLTVVGVTINIIFAMQETE